MSSDHDVGAAAGLDDLPDMNREQREAPAPRAHGASVINVLNDASDGHGLDGRETLYDDAIDYWRDHVGSRDAEPHLVALDESDVGEWLPPARDGREWVVRLTSSRWKCGTGVGDAYSAYFDHHLTLRERDDEGELHNPPLSVHVNIMPQLADLVYSDGNALELPYGEGTRLVCQTTWADSPDEVETRMYDLVETVYGESAVDRDALDDESRRLGKLEAHARFDIESKNQVVEALENSKRLIAHGGSTEIQAHQERQRAGWLEAVVSSGRWDLLGFDAEPFDREVKVYQRSEWHKQPETSPYRHPKLEASYDGTSGQLPHVSEWDTVMAGLRQLVSTHLEWADVDDEELVADDYYAGEAEPSYTFDIPVDRREQLREHYREATTAVYREALKMNTKSVYDILRVLAVEQGATYDVLEERVGLARSSIRYHVKRLEDSGIVKRIGNPVLVVFPSLEVLDRADEILHEVGAEIDAGRAEDMRERADERRRRREEREEREASTSDDGDTNTGESTTGDEERDSEPSTAPSEPATWRPFDELSLEPAQLARSLERGAEGDVDAAHVKVRVDPYEWIPDR